MKKAIVHTIDCAAAWRGSELPSLDEMAYQLSGQEIDEVVAAIAAATATGKPARELTAEDFPLPLLAPRIDEWRTQLADGLGFVIIRGVPVERWSQAEAELFFWCFGLHVGQPGEQNPDGHLLGHVIDTGASHDDSSTTFVNDKPAIRSTIVITVSASLAGLSS